MRLDVYTPSGTHSGTEANDVKRSGTVQHNSGPSGGAAHETAGPAWLKERPQVSAMGLLMRELHGIKQDDPEGFAQTTATIARRLHALSLECSDGSERLLAMAERFERASEKGDLSPFQSNPQPFGQALRGAWAYRQANELPEVNADAQAIIGQVLADYARRANGDATIAQQASGTAAS
jgi:hypothetical protein